MVKGEVRARMVATAARLLAEQGPTGASFGDVLKTSGAARGSTYHHFPQGKREMYDAALDLASQHVYSVLDQVRGDVDALAVDLDVAVVDELARREHGRRQLHAIDHGVEPALEQADQVGAGIPLHADGFVIDAAELPL